MSPAIFSGMNQKQIRHLLEESIVRSVRTPTSLEHVEETSYIKINTVIYSELQLVFSNSLTSARSICEFPMFLERWQEYREPTSASDRLFFFILFYCEH